MVDSEGSQFIKGDKAISARRVNGQGRTSDSIVRDLRRMIMRLELAPGSVVTEDALAQLLGCSRTPLREALQRLSQEHLVVAVPRRGVSVAEVSVTDLGDLAEMLDATGDFVTRLAAMRLADSDLAELERLLLAMRQAERKGDWPECAELNFEFHRVIIESTGNRYVIDAVLPLERLTTRFACLSFKRAGNAGGCIHDHTRIFEALRARDAEAAVLANRDHSAAGRERLKSAI